MTMLEFEFAKHCVDYGQEQAVRNLASPVRTDMRRFWTRVYVHDVLYCEPEDLPKIWDSTMREAFAPILQDLERYWDDVWLPPIRATQRFWSDFDIECATDDALAEHLSESLERIRGVWRIHFEIVFAVSHAWSMYYETYGEIFEGATRLEAMVPLAAFETLTAAAGRAIWGLKDIAITVPVVDETISSTEPQDVLARLRDVPEARVFLAAFDDYLAIYGRRSTSFNLGSKTLLEDPTPVISQVKDAIDSPSLDPRRHEDARATDREWALAKARDALKHYPGQLRTEFERRLAQAQVAVRLKEDHNFVIDYECTGMMRLVVMEVARRLSRAGTITEPDDVLHLRLDELQAAANALAASGTQPLDYTALVRERSDEMERFAGAEVPETLGPPLPTPPSAPAAATTSEAGMYTGVGMSAGVARGIVRVAMTFDDARLLRPGEVLVATSTSQSWTPLYATAAALVTEAGGVLSHMGVIAREYRLPAVSGIKRAIELLRDGMLVEVDGLAGTVTVLAEG